MTDVDISVNHPEALFINGQFVAGTGEEIIVCNPSNHRQLATVRSAGKLEVDAAVAAARVAFTQGPWPNLVPFERSQYLSRIAQAIEARCEDIARIDAISSGKPIKGARREVLGAARVFSYYAGLAPDLTGSTIPLGSQNFAFTSREPVGVVGQLVPWNFPFLAAAWKLAPALAAGCTVVLKTSPFTPLSALVLAEILQSVDLPKGVANILAGGQMAGSALVAHPGIDMISFTGSTRTGAVVMQSAAAGIKRVALELGGKSPTLVFADADLAAAASASVRAVFGNSGQSCSARSRIYVESAVYQEFVARLEAETALLKIGAVLDETTDLGPLISREHWQRVDELVSSGTNDGARLICGGGRPVGLEDGNYFQPTIFAETRAGMRIVEEEIFGPVVAVACMDASDAVDLANDSAFGLSASIWTKDLTRALKVAKGLRVGSININAHPSASQIGAFMPFGGFKQSGIGRELGRQGLEQYTETKNVLIGIES